MATRLIPIRDAQHNIVDLADEKTLADLLPPLEAAPAPEQRGAVPVTRQQLATVAGVGLGLGLAVALIVAINVRAPRATPPRATSAPAPTAAPAPTSRPAPTAVPPLAAFWGPGGERAPDVAPGAVQGARARYGDTWVLVRLDGGGEVWIARRDAGVDRAALMALPDLAPQPTPVVIERRVEVPQACHEAGVPGQMVRVCGAPGEDLEARARAEWIARYGGAP